MINPIELLKQLISIPSITPKDLGCQDILIQHLQSLGFNIEQLQFGEVRNFWARRGHTQPVFVFLGHTDVVPPGPLEKWTSPPFEPTIRDGYLYGRGAADMKSGIAAMLAAYARFIESYPDHRGSLAFLITSDEEGPSIDGTVKVVRWLQSRGEKIDWCLVGEASSVERLGDTIKVGRRGTLCGEAKILGLQGHIAYPQLADNPIHKIVPALQALTTTTWDHGNDFFQPTSFQISNIHAGAGATNVIPGHLDLSFNFRYSPEVTAEALQQRFEAELNRHHLNYEISWHHSGKPFLTQPGILIEAAKAAIESVNGINPHPSTTGGTSDGRFIAEMGCEVIEVGPINESIHKVNERTNIEELEQLTVIYEKLLTKLFLAR